MPSPAASLDGWQRESRAGGHGEDSAFTVAAGGTPPWRSLASPSASTAISRQTSHAPATSRPVGKRFGRSSSMVCLLAGQTERPQSLYGGPPVAGASREDEIDFNE